MLYLPYRILFMLPPLPRRRSLSSRAPRLTDEDVLDQLRLSLEALLKANRSLADMKTLLLQEVVASSRV